MDDEELSISYKWREGNASLQGEGERTLDLSGYDFPPEDTTISCTATVEDAHDGEDEQSSDAIQLVNRAPIVESVTISNPLPQVVDVISCEAVVSIKMEKHRHYHMLGR